MAVSVLAADQDCSNLGSVRVMCNATLYPDLCYNSLVSKIGPNAKPQLIYKQSAEVALSEVSKALYPDSCQNSCNFTSIKDLSLSAVESCRILFSLAIDNINNTLSSSQELMSSYSARFDMRIWLSAAETDVQTCADGFNELVYDVSKVVHDKLDNSTKYASNSLAIVSRIDSCLARIDSCLGTKTESNKSDNVPYWLASYERKGLLGIEPNQIRADIVVAKDGSGQYTRISDALNAVPNYSNRRFIIYVKKGVYYENVRVEMSKWNVMMIGDGLRQTIVSANLNHDGGHKTFMTATFGPCAKGFIAQRMGFINTAFKSQAVALMSTADKAVYYQCLMNSKQDTLFIQSGSQFYRECYIYGTIDFIFGDAAVVIQNSVILPKRPLPGQGNVITASGRMDPHSNTGISIQNCVIKAADNLTGVRTFLGRPWKQYSRVVFWQNQMDGLIDPQGWLAFNNAPPPRTIFFAENNNKGPGAVTNRRVRWPGVRVTLSKEEVSRFNVNNFVNGEQWLQNTGVPFQPFLL
ncbi:hypothetical protein DH2020_033842 [Rehmannia glutinosa]|uniref:Pectinesterase n=1 Tax=Rehmannia glutinosa TaxID=99300 RepID=A0ABR0VBM0_REHGL